MNAGVRAFIITAIFTVLLFGGGLIVIGRALEPSPIDKQALACAAKGGALVRAVSGEYVCLQIKS